ncbi:MAG: hypothetical protein IKR94_09100 [Bacteroidales bacterium]|nr:hypothetical protein [Bacteroidales bacterium]
MERLCALFLRQCDFLGWHFKFECSFAGQSAAVLCAAAVLARECAFCLIECVGDCGGLEREILGVFGEGFRVVVERHFCRGGHFEGYSLAVGIRAAPFRRCKFFGGQVGDLAGRVVGRWGGRWCGLVAATATAAAGCEAKGDCHCGE